MDNGSQNSLTAMTLGAAAEIAGGTIPKRWADVSLGAISTDSRSILPGMAFLAIKGENHDGHKFVAKAAELGAGVLIVASEFKPPELPAEIPILRVPDTLKAYGDLAAARRRAWGGPVLAISGSAGKTTTRRLVAAALAKQMKVLEPIRNYNNLIGVPETLLQLQPDHKVAVLELGMNQPGELIRLTEIAGPNAAMLTKIDRAHIGMFESMKALTDAKLDLFRGCAPGVPLVVNAGCSRTMKNIEQFRENHPIFSFRVGRPARGGLDGDVRIARTQLLSPAGYRFELAIGERSIGPMELRLFGRHHLENVAAAAALLLAGGYDPAWLIEALADFRTEPLRGQVVERDGVTWILDCYNASPPAMQSALESLLEFPYSGRRFLVLADMLELGKETAAAHAALVKPLVRLGRKGTVDFLGLGPNCTVVARDIEQEVESLGGSSRGFSDREALAETLKAELRPGDQVFLKGSHGFALEKVAEAVAPGIAKTQ
jgi:UDP-N-acetylmuramoyl-tripeptide--D-alanyl-D-alanine ligase